MGICKLCGEYGIFVRSHIIPLAFHRHLQSDFERPPIIIGNNPSTFSKRNPGGLYDDEMLCNHCEKKFGVWDQAGAEHLLQRFEADAEPGKSGDETLAYRMNGWDELLLRMFAISLLWRATVTTNYMFRLVKLGPHEEKVKACVLTGGPGDPNDLSVLLCKWEPRPKNSGLELAQLSPYCQKLVGVNVVKLFLGGFVIYVKTDQRPFIAPFPEIMLYPDRPVYAIARPFESSKDWAAMRPGVARHLRERR